MAPKVMRVACGLYIWFVSEALPTMLSLEYKDVSASTFAPQFGQKANEDCKPLPQFRQNMLDRSKRASSQSAANDVTKASMTV